MTDLAEQYEGRRQRAERQREPKIARAWLSDGGRKATTHLLLAHGAGAAMSSPFLTTLAELLAAEGLAVHRFNFPYMAAREEGLSRKPAPRAEALVSDYCAAIAECRTRVGATARLFIGGKSMGGRIACLAASSGAAGAVPGVVVLGFPLAPPRRTRVSRAHVIEGLKVPALIVQGTRDPFGGPAEFGELRLPSGVRVHWIQDGDHDLKPRRASGRTHDAALREAAQAIARFCIEV